jgi:hypothetical protein
MHYFQIIIKKMKINNKKHIKIIMVCAPAAPFPRLVAAHFASPGLCFAKPLSGLAKCCVPRTLCATALKITTKEV